MELELNLDGPVRPRRLSGPAPPRKTVERLALVVEDEWLVRLELVDALEAAGWTVSETGSGDEALALLAAGERFDLLVTDIRLHGSMNGWDVADACRAAQPGIGIVYASGNPSLEDRVLPGSVFMAKPVRIDAFIATCERVWKARETGGQD
jgi:CheY-like chemotaxis protein